MWSHLLPLPALSLLPSPQCSTSAGFSLFDIHTHISHSSVRVLHCWCSRQSHPTLKVLQIKTKAWPSFLSHIFVRILRADTNVIKGFRVKPVSLPPAKKPASWLTQRRISSSVPAQHVCYDRQPVSWMIMKPCDQKKTKGGKGGH